MKLKKCPKCKRTYPIKKFPVEGGRVRGYCLKCWGIKNREYRAIWYIKNRDKQIAMSSKNKLKRVERNVRETNKYKTNCCICGYHRCKRALDFHHMKDKKYDISAMVQLGNSLIKIMNEIKKCIVICANCHRELNDGMITIPSNIKMIGES